MSRLDQPLVVIGAGGHGREAVEIVTAINAVAPTWNLLGVLDDVAPTAADLPLLSVPYLGPTARMVELAAAYVVGIGEASARRRLDELATAYGRRAATLIHPRANVGGWQVSLGPGVIVAALASITTNVTVGRGSHVNVGTTVGHDCRLGDYTTLCPGAHLSGAVTVADDVFVGTGAMILQGLRIGPRAVLGAGAVVTRDVPADVVAVGTPARHLPRRRSPVGRPPRAVTDGRVG